MFTPIPADSITWEVEYDDGTVLRGLTPESYAQIDRDRLKIFKLIGRGEVLCSVFPPSGATGHNLVFRRRTSMTMSEGSVVRSAIFVIGWIPRGPAFAVDVFRGTFRRLENGFDQNDPELYPPVLMPGEESTLIEDALLSAKG